MFSFVIHNMLSLGKKKGILNFSKIQEYFYIYFCYLFLYFFFSESYTKTEKLFHINLHWPTGKSTPKYEIFGQRNHPLTQSLTHFKAKLTNKTDIYFFIWQHNGKKYLFLLRKVPPTESF